MNCLWYTIEKTDEYVANPTMLFEDMAQLMDEESEDDRKDE